MKKYFLYTFCIMLTLSCKQDIKTSDVVEEEMENAEAMVEHSTSNVNTKSEEQVAVNSNDKAAIKTPSQNTPDRAINNNKVATKKGGENDARLQIQHSKEGLEKEIAYREKERERMLKEKEARYGEILPDACDLINKKKISSIFKVPEEKINRKDGTTRKSMSARSCFYRWEDGETANAGVLIQVHQNPVPDEYAYWVSSFVESKKTQGERSFQTGETYIYKDIDGFGDEGVYSYELGKYVWRKGEEFAFMLAFNLELSESKQKSLAKKVCEEVMSHFPN